MTSSSRHTHPIRWQRLAVAAVGSAVACSYLVAAPSQASPEKPPRPSAVSPTTAEKNAQPDRTRQQAVPAPDPDILDVGFAGGTATDAVQQLSVTSHGDPTYGEDDAVGPIASFDGEDDALRVDFAEQWGEISDGFTMECVLRFDGALPTSGEKDICSAKQSGGFGIYVNGDQLGVIAHIGGSYKYARATISAKRWYHVATSWDGEMLRLHINGSVAAETPATGDMRLPSESARDLLIGSDGAPEGVTQFEAEASVAAVRMHSESLDVAQVRALADSYDLAPQAPEADVLSVDYSDGSATEDVQGLRLRQFGDPKIADSPALDGKVAHFDGEDDAYAYGLHDQWDKLADGFAVECSFRYNAPLPTGGEKNLCAAKNGGGFSITIYGDEITFNPYTDGGWRGAGHPIEPNRWYHAVGVWDGESAKLYVDGRLVAETAAPGELGLPTSTVKDFFVGADASGGDAPQLHAASTILNTQIFGRPLEAAEVAALNANSLGEYRHAEVNLVSSTPAEGSRMTSPTTFEVEIDHPGAATGWTYTLDGEEISPGQRIGAGLAAGDHLIEITATTVFGEPIDWRIPFTSSEIPAGGGTDTGQGDGSVTLSAIADAPGGGEVTTTFKKATATVADGGFSGVVPVMPSSLEFTYTDGDQISGGQVPDGETTQSATTGEIPFQRFDVTVPTTGAKQRVVWSGTVDPDRAAAMYAWHAGDQAWRQLDEVRGTVEGQSSIETDLPAGVVDGDGTVHLMVTGVDPFADDLAPRDETAQETKDSFEKPADYDFAFTHFTDTQYLAEGAAGGTYDDWDGIREDSDAMTAAEQAVWAKAYQATTDWIVENSDKRKIAFTAHSGDVIENNYHDPAATDQTGDPLYPGLTEQVEGEFDFTESAHDRLDQSGIVNQVVAGNHDNQMGAETGGQARFNDSFGPQRYYTAQQSWPEGASYHAWDEKTDDSGATVVQGKDNQNNYVLFSAGGLDFVSVGLSYGVTPEEAEWASEIFAKYPDRNGMLVTHAYLSPSDSPDGRDAGFSADGSRLFDAVVKANPNVFLVLAGHEHGVGTNVKSDVGVTVKHDVVELLADYQFYKVRADELFPGQVAADGSIDLDGDGVADHQAADLLQFGASFLRLLQFDVDRSVMSVDTYSPMLDNFGATEYDDRGRYNGAEDNTVLPVDLSSRTTTFATDALTVVTPTDEVIGEDTARSGWPASVEWKGLAEGEVYAWTSTSRSGSGDTIGTIDQFGGVFMTNSAGTDTTPPEITLPTGEGVDTVVQGEPFDPLAGVSATDNVDGDLSDQIQVTGTVDTEVPGAYALTYTVADANGNQVTVSRAVTVEPAETDDRTPVTVTASDVRVKFGKSAKLRAEVSAKRVSGTVTFLNGEEVLCETEMKKSGKVKCTVETLPPPGEYSLTVAYSGDDRHAPAEGQMRLVVTERK